MESVKFCLWNQWEEICLFISALHLGDNSTAMLLASSSPGMPSQLPTYHSCNALPVLECQNIMGIYG